MKQMNVTSKSIVGGKLLTVCAAAHSPNRPLGENRSRTRGSDINLCDSGREALIISVFIPSAPYLRRYR